MNAFLRWCRFNAVGVAGALVQLGTLALFSYLAPAHYLINTAAAIEVTLAHNFYWHLRYTWRDRGSAPLAGRCIRFQLSNGAVSLAGNLLLMKLLVQGEHLPVLLANGIAILICSLVNFGLGDRWVFADSGA